MPAGIIDGKLSPEKPNWVSSFINKSDSHYIEPLKFKTIKEFSQCIGKNIPEVKIYSLETDKIIGYRQSRIFHFVDWFCIHADGNVVSSATMGHYDFEKNRELIDKIRKLCNSQ